MNIGKIALVQQIKNFDVSEIILNDGNHTEFKNKTEHSVNLIQPSEQILNKRKSDLTHSDFKLDHLCKEEKEQLQKLLFENFAVFSKSLATLGHTDKVIPNLKLTNDFPIKTLPFPIPQALQNEALNQIRELADANIIERSCSEWACPILLVKKKPDGSGKQRFRLALDLRMLNTVIQGSSYPLPKIQTIISNLSSYKYFTSLDFQQAYHQIDLPEKFQDYVTFTSMFGSYKYKRLCFGLKTASSIFQSLMDSLLDEIQEDGIYSYQDDLILGANSFEETMFKLRKVFDVLKKYNLTLTPNKCSFHKTEVDYLGFHIQNHTISPVQANIIKINSFPVPTTKKQVKRFLGLATYYKSLLPTFSQIVQPLIDLTKPKVTFKWTQKHQEIFEKLQQLFFKPPIVRLPDWNKKFFVNTDASKVAISGVLMQKFGDRLLPIAYFSKSLKPSEQKYPSLKLELMAIHRSVLAFKYYLYNRNFVILSDSAPLKKYKKTTNPADITTRWLMDLSEYSYSFEHIPGSSNILADYLSRCNLDENQENLSTNPKIVFEENLPVIQIDPDKVSTNGHENYEKGKNNYQLNFLISGQNGNKDPLLEISNKTFVFEQKKDDKLSPIYNEILRKGSSKKFSNFFIHPDTKVLMIKKYDTCNDTYTYCIVVPEKLKAKTLTISHLSHFGFTKTYEFLSSRYFWRGMYNDTLNFVASCTNCLQSKHHRILNAPLQPTYTPKFPGHTISTDLLGPFENGQSILTIIDHFSRHAELYPLTDTSAQKVVKCLFSYISTHGRPSVILSDLGPQFTSHVYNNFNDTLGIKILHSSVAHPQSNAISERINKSIKYSIKTLLQEGHTFANAINIHKSLYNGSKHSSTQFSPNFLHFGRELSLIFDTYDSQCNQPFLDRNVDVYKLMHDLDKIYHKAYNNIKMSQERSYNYYQRKTKLRNIFEKDIVYLKSTDRFRLKYYGPFIVFKKHSPVVFSIKRINYPDESAFKVHVDRLLLAPPRNTHLVDNCVTNDQNTFQNISTPTHSYNLRPRQKCTPNNFNAIPKSTHSYNLRPRKNKANP